MAKLFPEKTHYLGAKDASIVVVTNQRTYDDDQRNQSFSDPQSTMVRVLMNRAGIDPNDCLYINISDDRIMTSGGATQEIIDKLKGRLYKRLDAYPRDLIIALGNGPGYALGVLPKLAGINGARLNVHEVNGRKITCSLDPFVVSANPQSGDQMFEDFKFAAMTLEGKKRRKYAPHKIIQICNPEDVNRLIKIGKKPEHNLIAYDHEGTNLNPYHHMCRVTTTAFNFGEMEGTKHIARVWNGYDQMRPLYEEHIMEQFSEAFVEFYMGANKFYDFLAWNLPYDDWMTLEEYPDLKKFDWVGSAHDGMIASYIVSSETRNGLKENSELLLGYGKYDAKVDELVQAVAKRRGVNLVDPHDLETLKRWGVEPVMKKYATRAGHSLKWPKKEVLSKKVEAFAMVPPKILVKYNGLDAIHTRLAMDEIVEMMDKENLFDPYEFRMRVAKRLLKGEMRGCKLDKKRNREFSKELKVIERKTHQLIQAAVKKHGYEGDDFNPKSDAMLASVLYGAPDHIPTIDLDSVIPQLPRTMKKWDVFNLRKEIEEFHKDFYAGIPKLRKLLRSRRFDYEGTEQRLKKEFMRMFGSYFKKCACKKRIIYVHGLYEPVAFTKTGLPSTAAAILTTLYEKKENDLLKLILMHRKASKLRSTFVDAIYKMQYHGIVFPHYNSVGTTTGRISSCVRAGTLVETPRGKKPIEELREGDEVIGHDLKAHKCLTDAFKKPPARFYKVRLANGATIECTMLHKFYTPKGWKELLEISADTPIFCYPDSLEHKTLSRVVEIEPLEMGDPWDVSIEGSYSYLAQGFVNHNSNYNCQNFPKYIRGQMIPRKGYWFINFDLSQAEIRVVAAYSQDPDLLAALNAEDIHKRVASMVYGIPEEHITEEQRGSCKSVVFGILYGQGAPALALALGWELQRAEMFIETFLNRFPKLREWLEEQVAKIHIAPHTCYTPFGTRRSLRNILSTDSKERMHMERCAVNSPIQGGAGEYTLWLICEIFDRIEARYKGADMCYLFNTTHDSVTIEAPIHMCQKSMLSRSPVMVKDKKGRDTKEQVVKYGKPLFKEKWEYGGPIVDIINEVVALPAPVAPLDTVTFPVDIDIMEHWYGEPNLMAALDPKEKVFRWDLLDDSNWTREERKEFEELVVV